MACCVVLRHYYLIFVALCCCSTFFVKPDSSAVYILNEHLQLVTSTSLRWVSIFHSISFSFDEKARLAFYGSHSETNYSPKKSFYSLSLSLLQVDGSNGERPLHAVLGGMQYAYYKLEHVFF